MPWVIAGTVTEEGVPVARTVRIYRRDTGALLDEQVSSTAGEFEFANLNGFATGREFYVIALDDEEAGEDYNALISDRITAEFADRGDSPHRYWRVRGISVPGSFLEISELQLLQEGVDVTAEASKSSSDAPSFGSLSLLFDGNLSSRCFWTNTIAEGAGFWIAFDFGDGEVRNVTGVKQGGYDTSDRYMDTFTLEHSDDGVSWTALGTKSGLAYPGNFTLSTEYTFP